MSFLGSIVGSIGDGKAPPPPADAVRKPANVNALRTNSVANKPGSRPTTPVQTSGIKRKAEDGVSNMTQRPSKPGVPAQAAPAMRRPAAPPLNGPRPSADKMTVPNIQTDKLKTAPSRPSPTNATSSLKPPPTKGSFADLMARAKQQNTQQKVGVLTHQKSAPKEKLSKRALEKRAEEEKIRSSKSGNAGVRKPDSRRSASPVKNGVKDGRVAKPVSSRPVYKGTMGTASGRGRHRPAEKKSRYDSYLGTDEEDNSDIDEDDVSGEDGYESSDMEGGFDDLQEEESRALRQAKADDAREAALETQLKREKEERRKKLMGLAAKRR
jgi:protein SPT2